MNRRLFTLLAGLICSVAIAPPAGAQDLPPYTLKIFTDFGSDGQISPCKHTVSDLRKTQKFVGPDVEQYGPELPAQIRAALEAHARGDCAGRKPEPATATVAPTPVPTVTPAPTEIPTKKIVVEPPGPATDAAAAGSATPAPLGPATADPEIVEVVNAEPTNAAPAPVWMLGGVGGLLGLASLFLLVAGRTRRGEDALERFAHSWREAAWRASGTWGDFREWVRTGR